MTVTEPASTDAASIDSAVPVAPCAPRRIRAGEVDLVEWSGADGATHRALDRCPHRRAPLSAGEVVDGVLRCPYHGWGFGDDGHCVDIPAIGADARIPSRARVEMVTDVAVDLPVVVSPVSPVPSVAGEGMWLDGDTPGLARFWHPACRIGELPSDGVVDVDLLGHSWHVTRDAGDSLAAVRDDGRPAARVTMHLDHVWIAPEEPRIALPDVPEWGREGQHHRRLSRAEGDFGVGLLLDNQLDAGHFAFVHAATFGTPDAAVLPPAEIERSPSTVSCTMRVPIAARNDAAALDGVRGLDQFRTMHYEFHAPLWLRLQLDYEPALGTTILLFAFVPQGYGRARMDVDILFSRPAGFTDAELDERLAFEETVVAEDLRLQRLFTDLRLPLDPAAELHTRADRYSVVCRQLLRDLLGDPSAVRLDDAR